MPADSGTNVFPRRTPPLKFRGSDWKLRGIKPLRILRQHLLSPIIQFGPPRTGSTLVWNAIRTVCAGQEIPKRHHLSLLHRSPLCRASFVCTVRNPLDIVASMLGVSDLAPNPSSISEKLTELQRYGMADAVWLANRPRVLVLRYEDFYGDFDQLFHSIESFLGRTASASARHRFEKRFCIEEVRRRAAALGGFHRFDEADQIHGRHISKQSGRPGYHVDVLNEADIRRIRAAFPDFTATFGY